MFRFRSEDNPASALLALLLIAVLPLIGFQFGVGSQVEQFSIVARVLDPEFLTGDFFLNSAAGFGPRYYYTRALAGLVTVVSLPVAIIGLSLIFNFLLALVTYRAARAFLRCDLVGGLIAATMVVLNESFSLGLAGNPHFESFQPASIAIPLSLIGFSLLLSGRPFVAIPALVLASLAHPLIGVEIALLGFAGAAGAGVLFPGSEHRFGAAQGKLVISGLLFGFAIFLAWVLPALSPGGERLTDAEFFDILPRFRAPHHYLGLDFPRRAWLLAILFTTATALILVHHWQKHGPSRAVAALGLSVLIIVALCAASLWFVDIAESRIWVTAQVFRMVMMIKWVGFLALGWLCMGWVREGGFAGLALTAAIIVASAEAHTYVIFLAVATKLAVDRGLVRRWLVPVAVIASLAASMYFTRRYGIEEQSLRALAAVACIALILAPWPDRRVGVVLAVLFAGLLITVTTMSRENGLFGRRSLQAQFSLSDISGPDAQIMRRAREMSPPDALWMVPPDFESFRILAQRSVVADFTSVPFDDLAMLVWRQRMEVLYGPVEGSGFAALRNMRKTHLAGTNIVAAATQYRAEYAILYKATPWQGDVLFENDAFKAVRLTGMN